MEIMYSLLLKRLINYTDIKLILLAQELGYDVSYISKWCSGAKLPSAKNVFSINKTLSKIFAEIIFEEHNVHEFLKDFHTKMYFSNKLEESQIALETAIYNLLNDAYKRTNPSSFVDNNINETYFVIEKHNIHQILHEELKKVLNSHGDGPLDLWTNFDLLSETAQFILKELQNALSPRNKKKKRVKVHMGMDTKKIQPDKQGVNAIYETLNHYAHINVECFDNSHFPNVNFIIIEDCFFADLSLDDDNNFLTMTYGFNIDTINKYFNFVRPYFNDRRNLIRLTTSDEMAQSNYRTNFYAGQEFSFICNYGFEFLLPRDLLIKLADYSIQAHRSEYEKMEILRLSVTWEEIFEKAESTFFVPWSTFFDYMETGELLCCSTHYAFDVHDRRKHIEHVIQVMEKNSNIHFYMIEDDLMRTSPFLKNFNIFCNESSLYVKNINMAPDGESSMVSILQEPSLFKVVSLWLQSIKERLYCKELSAQDIREVYERYAKMFYRLDKVSKIQE